MLQMKTLKKYKKKYELSQETNNKQELVEVVSEHFRRQEVVEIDTIILFRCGPPCQTPREALLAIRLGTSSCRARVHSHRSTLVRRALHAGVGGKERVWWWWWCVVVCVCGGGWSAALRAVEQAVHGCRDLTFALLRPPVRAHRAPVLAHEQPHGEEEQRKGRPALTKALPGRARERSIATARAPTEPRSFAPAPCWGKAPPARVVLARRPPGGGQMPPCLPQTLARGAHLWCCGAARAAVSAHALPSRFSQCLLLHKDTCGHSSCTCARARARARRNASAAEPSPGRTPSASASAAVVPQEEPHCAWRASTQGDGPRGLTPAAFF